MEEKKVQDTEKISRLSVFKARIKGMPLQEIHKKIKLWIRRMEQFEILGDMNRTREMYEEFRVMLEVLHEICPKRRKAPSGSADQIQNPLQEIDLRRHSLSILDPQEILAMQNVLFRFYSNDKYIEQIHELAIQKFEMLPFEETEKINLDVALREAIGNAHRHGHKYDAKMSIEFHYFQSNESLILRVTDQGEGFDHGWMLAKKKAGNAVEEARERHQQGGYGGLGIMLMLQCVDKIEYNEKGNQLTLIKYFPNG